MSGTPRLEAGDFVRPDPLPPIVDEVGLALLAAAMAIGVCAIATTLVTTAPLVRAGVGWGPATEQPKPQVLGPLVMLTGGAVITFIAFIAFNSRCGSDCIDSGGPTLGDRVVWWRMEEAWQWSGQLAVASIGLAAAALALVCAVRGWRRFERPLLIVTRVAYTAWALAALVVPLGLELVAG